MKNDTIPAPEAAPLDPLASLAIGIRGSLAETRATIESCFSATGDNLIECTMSLNAISAAHEGLPGALDGEEFAQAEASLKMLQALVFHEDWDDDGKCFRALMQLVEVIEFIEVYDSSK